MLRTLLLSTPFLAVVLISGCWVTWDEECGFPFGECEATVSGGGGQICDDLDDCDDEWYWDDDGGGGGSTGPMVCVPGTVRYCDTPTYCSWGEQVCNNAGDGWSECYEGGAPLGCSGFIYDEDCCIEAGGCCQDWWDYDNDGDTNDNIGNCPVVPTCTSDEDCPGGYCLAEEGEVGQCATTGSCSTDDDCLAFGSGLVCDDRGICSPEDEPCPTGDCGCTSDAECADGMMCLGSRCADPAAVCFFDFECGDGSTCLDNECHATCECDLECPTGQGCAGGLCMTPEVGADGCVFNEDCGVAGVFECINATCHAACTASDDCGPNETCRSNVCRAATAPTHECSDSDGCGQDMECVRGACRLPCAASINCGDDMTVCGDDGLCLHPEEVGPECTRADDCADGEACLGNICTNL